MDDLRYFDPGLDPPDDVSCTFCGSFNVEHVPRHRAKRDERQRLARPDAPWFNRCRDCRRLQEYIPSKAVIAEECAALLGSRTTEISAATPSSHDERPFKVTIDLDYAA